KKFRPYRPPRANARRVDGRINSRPKWCRASRKLQVRRASQRHFVRRPRDFIFPNLHAQTREIRRMDSSREHFRQDAREMFDARIQPREFDELVERPIAE